MMQLEVLNRWRARACSCRAGKAAELHRHLGFLDGLLSRVENERSNHVRKAWLPSSMAHSGTLPCAPKSAPYPKKGWSRQPEAVDKEI